MFIFSHVSPPYMWVWKQMDKHGKSEPHKFSWIKLISPSLVSSNDKMWRKYQREICKLKMLSGGLIPSTSWTAADRPESEESQDTLITSTSKYAGLGQGDTTLATSFPEPALKDKCFHLSWLPHSSLPRESFQAPKWSWFGFLGSDDHTNLKH